MTIISQVAMQDRRACCGTLNNAQYFDLEDVLEVERQALARWCQGYAARHSTIHRRPARRRVGMSWR
ncbi:hypothetical protein [Massilia sp. METH4]|uniref:hypothetical protein n=1 Tax=Massilia sp. METH4 TaxID=3123041 RepID=UPI0030CECEAC